jgi:hypothetical protein
MFNILKTNNMKYEEKLINTLLEPFRIKKRAEWFYLSNDLELNYALNVIKNGITFTNVYNFTDYNLFKTFIEKCPNQLDNRPLDDTLYFEKPKKFKNVNFLNKHDKISKYNGVTFSVSNNKWASRLTKDNTTLFLGYYDTELDAAIAYNDYASYINKKEILNYHLNNIEEYVPNPRDIIAERLNIKLQNKSSEYTGVYFIKSKQLFEASIQYKKKNYKLCKDINSIECAKVYNEQAMYFNNHLGTKYKLNNISDFITEEKNHILELEASKIKKYSRFSGVSIRNDTGKFRAYIKYNGKRIDCGTFANEIDAAKAYNKKAEELNQLETTKMKYMLNNLDD